MPKQNIHNKMKYTICLLLAVATLWLQSSCTRDDEPVTPTITPTADADDENNEEENDTIKDMTTVVPVAFIAKIDDRYDLSRYTTTRCVLEIYSGVNKIYETINVYPQPSTACTMVAELDEGDHYTCLLWIDFDENGYDISGGLKNVRTGNKPTLAFYAALDFDTDTKKYEVTLHPAVAKMALVASNGTSDGIGSFGVYHAMPFQLLFNVANGNAFIDDGADAYTPRIDFEINSISEDSEVAHFYTFVPDDGLTVDLEIDFNGTHHEEKDVDLRKGCATTLTGDLETMDFNIKITDLIIDEPSISL